MEYKHPIQCHARVSRICLLGLHNFVIELVYVPSTNHRKKSNERTSK